MEIYIIRHGQTVWNKSRRLQGRTDIELNENGIRLAIESGENMKDIYFDKIYCSPLTRAKTTAELIRGERDIELIVDDRLKELCFGEYEGRDFRELVKDLDDPFHYFYERPDLYQAPKGGESFEEITKRAAEFLIDVIEPQKNLKRIMIVAHGAMNKALLRRMRHNELRDYWQGGLQKNCGVTIANLDESGYTIIEENKLFYQETDK